MRRIPLYLTSLFIIFITLYFLPKIFSISIGKSFFVHRLEKKFDAKIEIEKVSFSWFGPQVFQTVHYSTSDVRGTVVEIQFQTPFWSLSKWKNGLIFKDGSFLFLSDQNIKIEHVNGKIENTNIQMNGKTSQNGFFSVNGQVDSRKKFDIFIDASNLPVKGIDSLFKCEGLLYSILGSQLNLKGSIQLNEKDGFIDLSLFSSQLKTDFKAQLIDKKILLKTPLKIAFDPIHPLSRIKIKTKNPIYLTIAEKDFECSFPPSLTDLHINHGIVQLGQLECEKNPELLSLLSLFKKSHFSNSIHLWFTPVFFQINKGILTVDRIDALIEYSIHLCCWGSINLMKNSLDMFLGIPANTLSNFFGIHNVHSNYVLKLPLKGSINNPKIEIKAASSKIAAMAISQQIPKGRKFLNPFIYLFSQIPDEDDAPPARRPFPWEK